MIGLDVVSALAFFIIVGILLVKDRKDVEFNYGLILKRWSGGIERIDRFVRKHRRFLFYLGAVSIVTGIVGGLIGIGFLTYCAVTLNKCFGLVLPSVGGVNYPGPVVSIPFWYWLVAIFVIVATHESMHAVFARYENIPVKSYGIMFLLTLPIGAFVDPDDQKIKKLKSIQKMKIFSAGSFANFVTAGLVILIVVSTGVIANGLMQPYGVKFQSTLNGTPAQIAGLNGIIQGMNGIQIKNVNDLVVELSSIKPNQNITIATSSGVFNLTTAANPLNQSVAYLGISNARNVYVYKFGGYVPDFVLSSLNVWSNLLFWILLLSIGVGVVNMLPIKPLDGGLMFEEIFDTLFKEKSKIIGRVVTVVMLGLVVFNLIGVWLLR